MNLNQLIISSFPALWLVWYGLGQRFLLFVMDFIPNPFIRTLVFDKYGENLLILIEIKWVFPWILWRWWKHRNGFIFKGKSFQGDESLWWYEWMAPSSGYWSAKSELFRWMWKNIIARLVETVSWLAEVWYRNLVRQGLWCEWCCLDFEEWGWSCGNAHQNLFHEYQV